MSPLDKEEADKFVQGRIKSLKDVVEVKFEIEKDEVLKTEKWMCPVTGKELGVNVRAVFIVPCGHAFSQEALREMKSDTCSVCAERYEQRDIVPILPSTDADKAFALDRIDKLKAAGLTHSLKKAKGEKKRKANGELKNGEAGTKQENGELNAVDAEKSRKSSKTQSADSKPQATSNINHGATASMTAKVLAEEAAKKKRRLVDGGNQNIQSLYNKNTDGKVKDSDFMTRGFSIPANGRR